MFSGEENSSWRKWIYHFEGVPDVNGWNDATKLKWMKVRLTGRAQSVFQQLPAVRTTHYDGTKKALKERFEPSSWKGRYQSELQARRKQKSESWTDFADDLRLLNDKVFPDLQEEAKETLVLTYYLQQLDNPQLALSVRQQHPTTLDAAISAMLEMEMHVTSCPIKPIHFVANEPEEPVSLVTSENKIVSLLESLTTWIEKLETEVTKSRGHPN